MLVLSLCEYMGRKIPDGLHSALYELLDLLGSYYSENNEVGEEDFQTLFEEYNYLWAVLGYSSLVRQPKCDLLVEENIQGEYIEPDFIAYNEIRNQWEIVDLKLPKRSIQLSSRKRRKRFKSEIEDYIAQVQEYSEYFNENSHRKHVKSEHDVEIPSNPPVVLVMGSSLDQEELNSQLDRYAHDISIIQYDTILALLKKEFEEKSGEEDGLPGLTVASRVTLMAEPESPREYIFDIGKSLYSERLSLYLTSDGKLTLEITSKTGLSIDVSVPWQNVLKIGEQRVLYVEFASTEELSFARVFAGSEILDEMLLTMEVPFSGIEEGSGFSGVDDEFDLYLGADQNGERGATFANHELIILSKAEELEERIEFMQYLERKTRTDYQGIFLEEDEFAYTKENSDLTKADESEEFEWIDGKDWVDEYLS
jgi:hypothetical protein